MSYIGERQAFLLFVDIIDSSKFSSLLGYKHYGNIILKFNDHFKKLVKVYFQNYFNKPDNDEENNCFEKIDFESVGDEGSLFLTLKEDCFDYSAIAYELLSFLYELKSSFTIEYERMMKEEGYGASPAMVEFAAGFHLGTVGLFKAEDGKKQIIGYAINYAKRVESASRQGRFSKILVSQDVFLHLQKKPVFLEEITSDLKGIKDRIKLYEVVSALVQDIPRAYVSNLDPYSNMINRIVSSCDRLEIDSTWMRSMIASFYNSQSKKSRDISRHDRYEKLLREFVFKSNVVDDDPVISFLKVYYYIDDKQYVTALKLLDRILDKYPNFTKARIKLIELIVDVFEAHENIHQVYFAKESALDYIHKYSHLVSETELHRLKEKVEKANNCIAEYNAKCQR